MQNQQYNNSVVGVSSHTWPRHIQTTSMKYIHWHELCQLVKKQKNTRLWQLTSLRNLSRSQPHLCSVFQHQNAQCSDHTTTLVIKCQGERITSVITVTSWHNKNSEPVLQKRTLSDEYELIARVLLSRWTFIVQFLSVDKKHRPTLFAHSPIYRRESCFLICLWLVLKKVQICWRHGVSKTKKMPCFVILQIYTIKIEKITTRREQNSNSYIPAFKINQPKYP